MTRKHRLLTILLALALLLGTAALPAAADTRAEGTPLSTEEKANALYELGLFRGTGFKEDGTPEYALDNTATRSQGAVMLIRLLGKENKAQAQYTAGAVSSPLTDLESWAASSVTWLYSNNLTNGTGNTTYSGKNNISAAQFATFILRALGYSDSGAKADFSYAQALSFAVEKQVITQEQSAAYQADFRRGGMVEMCYNALYLKMNDSSLTLLEKLTNDGIFKDSYQNNTTVAGTKAMTLTQKYKGGGLPEGSWYMEEQCFGNAVCADLDGDGKKEIVFGTYSIFCVNAADGKLKWRIEPQGSEQSLSGRVPFQVLDWDGDGKLEVFAMTFADPNGYVKIIDGAGNIKQSWTINSGYQIRAGYPADLDGDGKYELAIGMGVGASGAPAVYVYNNDGTVRSGWPQVQGYGLYSNSITAVDLDGDGMKEIVLTYDDTQIVAFRADGTRVTASAFGATWDKVDFFANYDKVGYNPADLVTSDIRNGLMGTYGGLVADDLDGDGRNEIVGVALINNIKVTSDNMSGEVFVNSFAESAQYFSPFIINLDRTRYKNAAKGFDWSRVPADTGSIYTLYGEVLSTGATVDFTDPDYHPVTADVDGDGIKEILYSSNDGQVHCFSLDGTEHGAWPFALNNRSTSVPDYVRYASRPTVKDINGDGKMEVIFTTYTPRGQTSERGKLYVLDYTGKKIAETTLPPMLIKDEDVNYADGCSTSPIVEDIDSDGQYEIVVATFNCGLVAYEIG